jgi:uncharacterized protein involved in exopolysaccharide biosynthesis
MLSFFRQLGRFPRAERRWIRIGGWAVTGLAAGFLVSFLLPAHYTSEAILHVVVASVSQDLLPHEDANIENLMEKEKPIVLSRNVIITIINNFDLYPGERKRVPMEDVVEEFRKSVRIELSGTHFIRVAFTYSDRLLANKVTQDLASRTITEHLTQRSVIATSSVQFFQDQVDKLGKSWLQASANLKATPSSDPRYELLALERDQKRKEYESAAQKLGTAEMLKDLANRGQDSTLQLLDAASLPQEPETPQSIVGLIGLGCGLAIGLVTTLRHALRRTPPGFSIPAAEEPA